MICHCCQQPIIDGDDFDVFDTPEERLAGAEGTPVHECPDICVARVAERAIEIVEEDLGDTDPVSARLRDEFMNLIDYAAHIRRERIGAKDRQ